MSARASGILLHLSSLPGGYGIGSLGRPAFRFIDFLRQAGQRLWQILPIGVTGYGDSPYQCFSSFAGNPYFIDLDALREEGLLTARDLAGLRTGTPDEIDYGALYKNRPRLLRKAYKNRTKAHENAFETFCEKHSSWIWDYSLFMAANRKFRQPLWEWPDEALKLREPEALARWWAALAEEIRVHAFAQYLFFGQWERLARYAAENGVKIVGDLPFYTAADSADVWVRPELFKVNRDLSVRMAAGVPPDDFSETGQLWGNPVYDWPAHKRETYDFWCARMSLSLTLFDRIRIDHFRGFCEYWEVPIGQPDATAGHWHAGPGVEFFLDAGRQWEGRLIAEDLGFITPKVRAFLNQCGFPGMKVLAFGFNGDPQNEHLPHRYEKNMAVYTSTHDTMPFQAVFDALSPFARKQAANYLDIGEEEKEAGQAAIKSLWASSADTAIAAMQDILSLGAESVMNRPSVPEGNWRWRVREEALCEKTAAFMREITEKTKRTGGTPG